MHTHAGPLPSRTPPPATSLLLPCPRTRTPVPPLPPLQAAAAPSPLPPPSPPPSPPHQTRQVHTPQLPAPVLASSDSYSTAGINSAKAAPIPVAVNVFLMQMSPIYHSNGNECKGSIDSVTSIQSMSMPVLLMCRVPVQQQQSQQPALEKAEGTSENNTDAQQQGAHPANARHSSASTLRARCTPAGRPNVRGSVRW